MKQNKNSLENLNNSNSSKKNQPAKQTQTHKQNLTKWSITSLTCQDLSKHTGHESLEKLKNEILLQN